MPQPANPGYRIELTPTVNSSSVPKLTQSVQTSPVPKSPNGSHATLANPKSNGNGESKNDSGEKKNGDKRDSDALVEGIAGTFCERVLQQYPTLVSWFPEWLPKPPSSGNGDTPTPRRALDAPLASPPFPSGEWQGYPLVGVPPDSSVYPLMGAIYNGPWGEEIKESRIRAYGWVNASGNWSTARNSNMPSSYWIVPNRFELDQFVLRLERQVDSVQQDHIDVGFRSTLLYGLDYRYMTAGGWFSEQLLKHNALYGWDPTEQYVDVYVPHVAEGLILRVGRWIACPDIETQFAPDNYMGTHSILFTFDTYTQTGVMATVMLDQQWTVQAALHAGTDMAPWYPGATPTGMFGVRWVSLDNNDSIYLVLNSINNARFRYFEQYGQPLGHDNFNYLVGTWQHKFNETVHTKTEAYYMWQYDAVLGGTPSAGPVKPFGGGGGLNADMILPGLFRTYGVVNYTMCKLSDKDFVTFRNEVWRDERGMRSSFPGTYSSNSFGMSHNFTQNFQIRPEIGYYRNWDNPAFGLGTSKGMWLYGFDVTLRF
jgi:hypothetical protein